MQQVLAGLLIFAIGIGAMLGLIPTLADYTYAILWWGVLLVVDRYNKQRRGLSLWDSRRRHFLLITLPVSVLLWLLFELMNLPAPQWRYKGGLENIHVQVLFGFVAFTTVIPIMVESYWLFAGRFCLPAGFSRLLYKWRAVSILMGLVFAAIPFFNENFWFNQGIWLSPALILLPFATIRKCESPGVFLRALALSALLAGFCWESLNYWSPTHWEYLILPNTVHLFQMPVPGYLGFIPFALTALVVYEQQLRIPPKFSAAILLYAASFAVLYLLTNVYVHRGLWLLK